MIGFGSTRDYTVYGGGLYSGQFVFALLFGVFGFAAETVHLTNGQFQKGNLVSQTEEILTFEFTKSGSTDKTRVNIPWNRIERIEFGSTVTHIDALAKPEQTDLNVFAELWDEGSPWLSRPNSPTAKIGLVYAKKLVESGVEMAPEQGLDLYSEIAAKAWNPADQAAAIQGRLRTLFSLDRERDAIREAEALAAKTENPHHLLEAKYALASNAFSKLKNIEEENPRWYLDEEVKPGRNRAFNMAIDHSLFAFLFFGSEEKPSARGLLLAASVYEFSKDYKNAELCAQDILRLYPETTFATQAKEKLTELSKRKSE